MATKDPIQKDPAKQLQGKLAKIKGKRFEDLLDRTVAYYDERGSASIEKTPEPMHIIKSMGQGRFLANFAKKAQPDYQGTLKGGRSVMFEAKYTDTDRVLQSRVKVSQQEYMTKHSQLGARCYVVIGFRSGEVYRIPFSVWMDMKQLYGRKYVTEADVQEYRVGVAWNDTLLLL